MQQLVATSTQRSTGFVKQGNYTGVSQLAYHFISSRSIYELSQLLIIVDKSRSLDQLVDVI